MSTGNDLPTADNTNGAEDKNPLLATLEAMQRLKATSEQQEIRIKNLEDAFELAFKNGAKSLEEFLNKMDAKDGSSDEEEEDAPPASVGDETMVEEEESKEASSGKD